VISISTYQEEDLSREDIKVDASGKIILPLIGSVQAAGHTAEQLSGIIARRFGERYLQNPQVTVVVNTSASQRVVVEGAVKRAGVFPIEGGTTLLQAIALANGTSEVASVDDVVIFRTLGGQKLAGAFNLRDIRRGVAQDPEILGNDVVVVGLSSGKQLYRDILAASPLIAGIFRPIATAGTN
jgi:polysaccharide export outer membrane protein